jgi:hypothetical protein
MSAPRVLLDPSVGKLASTRVIRCFARRVTLKSGSHSLTLPVTQCRLEDLVRMREMLERRGYYDA